jgi:secondary thiamine-phosphate synthase enzyme
MARGGYGYSAYWFARAVGPDGAVVCTDGDPENARLAEDYLRTAGMWERVRHRVGDALGGFAEEAGDFIARSRDDGGMDTDVVQLRTGTSLVTDITDLILRFCCDRGDGLCQVFVPHATAGVALIETGSGSESDLEEAIDRLLPRDDIYRHRHGSRGHGRDHVLPAFISPSLTMPVLDGQPTLGTWQSVVLVDTNADNPDRKVRLSFLPG